MANDLLVEYQEKEYQEVIAEYFFECTGGGVTKAVASPKKEALKKGIKLHFFRYGFFEKKSAQDSVIDLDSILKRKKNYTVNEVKIANSNIPELENFYLARTFLRPGYVYVIDKNDNNKYKEYQVNESGKLTSIVWTRGNDGDIRKPSGNARAFITINSPGEYYVVYSPVQWGRKFFNEINGSDEKKQEFMQTINCVGIEIGNTPESDEVVSYKDVKVVSFKDHLQRGEFRDNLREIYVDEEKETEKGGNDFYEDMFVMLDDPIGCSMDICPILGDQITKQKAIVECMQTGRDLNRVYPKMLRGEKSALPNEEEQQIGALVNLALTEYQLVYNNTDMIDDYDGGRIGWGAGVYKPKLLNILEVDYRKKHRQVIRSLQNDLGNYLISDYYQKGFLFMEKGTDLNCIDGKCFAVIPLKLLAIKPHLQDKAFDLKKNYEEDTKWDYLIYESLKEESDSSVYNTLNKQVNLDEETIKQGIDLSNKLAAFILASLETYADYAMEDVVTKTVAETITKETVKGNYKLLVKRLNKINVYGEEMFEVRGYEVREKLHAEGWEIDKGKIVAGKYKGVKDLYRWVKTKSPELILKETSHGRHVFDVPVTKEVETVTKTVTETTHRTPTKLGAKASAVLEGAPFRGVVALLQVFNIGAAYHTFSQDLSYKNGFNLFGIGAELTSATAYFVESTLANVIGKESMRNIAKLAIRANVVGAGVTVIMCTWEACLSFDARDNDAALAWTGAAAAFSGVTVAAIFAGASWAGPLGLICAGIGVGLVFLAYYFKDSPLETFFKNNALSDEKDFPRINDLHKLPGDYIRDFYANVNDISSDLDNRKWNDFKFAGAELTDLIVCSDITIKGTRLFDVEEEYLSGHKEYSMPTFISSGKIKTYEIRVSFRQFLQNKEQFVYELYFYKDGIKGSYQKIKKIPDISIEKGTENTPPQIVIKLVMPDHYLKQYTKNSQILVVCALALGDDEFYPSRYNKDTRFLGAYASVNQSELEQYSILGLRKSNHIYKSNVAVEPMNQLLSGNAWK